MLAHLYAEPPFIDRLYQALQDGPVMYAFDALVLVWIALFFWHVRSAKSRFWTSNALVCLAIVVALLAPLQEWVREEKIYLDAWQSFFAEVAEQHERFKRRIILWTALALLAASIAAWLMPKPSRGDAP